jgi:pimeloyl-ACP methyl ester carboxylesterase
MDRLEEILAAGQGWTIVGSSLGGLMAALYARRHPGRVRKLVLLAPALTLPEFAGTPQAPLEVPTILFIGTQDSLIPLEDLRPIAESAFTNLSLRIVVDEHGLYKTAAEIDWEEVLE